MIPNKDSKIKIEEILNDKNLSRSQIILEYRKYCKNNNIKEDLSFIDKLKTKPIRTLSGVVPITVLTKPFPCPGKCIFCPDDVMMPKSYLTLEPGAQRALMNKFDPYLQVKNRMQALQNIGHKTEKIELLVLGGTWSVYPRHYQEWFIKRCLDAMNEFQYKEYKYEKNRINFDTKISEEEPSLKDWNIELLKKAQKKNEKGKYRCIGITLETRPDRISKNEVIHLRELGATKIQLGIQNTNDYILNENKRGENSEDQKKAINLLRRAGFKIQIHWMPNLYKSTPKTDKEDIEVIYSNGSYMPDEIKIYPCSVIESAELYTYWKNKKYQSYTEKDLMDVLIHAKLIVPEYSRINRLIRDIPSTYIETGNKKTNFRQIVQEEMKRRNLQCRCIRCREIRNEKIEEIKFKKYQYETSVSKEFFLSFNSKDKILGFLRLSIPKDSVGYIKEIENCSIIREVHVYGKALGIKDKSDSTQHLGLGSRLIKEAEKISKKENFSKIAVISGIGTREYYKKRGFKLDNLYQIKILTNG
jgi:elongator complex protein 3